MTIRKLTGNNVDRNTAGILETLYKRGALENVTEEIETYEIHSVRETDDGYIYIYAYIMHRIFYSGSKSESVRSFVNETITCCVE